MRPCGRDGVLAGVLVIGLATAGGCGGRRQPLPTLDPRSELEMGRAEFARRHWLDAQGHFKKFLDLHPGHAAADSAQLLVAMSIFEQKSYAEAAVEFAVLGREYPRSGLGAEAALRECLCYFHEMRPPQLDPTFAFRSRDCLNEFMLRYPESSWREEAEKRLADITDALSEKDFRLGVMFARLKHPRAARVYLEGVLQEYPTSRWVPQSLLWLGRSYEQQGMDAEAVTHYRRLIATYPDDSACKEARGRLRKLSERHPELEGSSAAGPAPAGP